MNLKDETIFSLVNKIKNRQISVTEVVQETLRKIKEEQELYNAFIYICEKEALEKAYELDKRIEENKTVGELVGIPIAIKDNICVKNIETTCGSKILEKFIAPYNADVVESLLKEDAIIIGKTNMDEFGMGSTTETSIFGSTKNIYDTSRTAGGSSGGSAVAVAANECIIALGTDTGGSIRQPASYMGVVGIKPTYGSVSRYGLIAYASSFDTIGPIAKNVTDAAHILNIISRYDKRDGTSLKVKRNNCLSGLKNTIKGMKIAVPNNCFTDNLNDEIKNSLKKLIEVLKREGAIIEYITLNTLSYVVPTYYVLACAQASSNLARYDGVKYGYRSDNCESLDEMYKKTRTEGFGLEVKRRIMLGNYILSKGYYDEYYLKALKIKTLMEEEYKNIFVNYDAILAPVVNDKPPKLGESLDNPIKMYLNDIYTTAANIVGLPAITVPIDKDENGFPIGVQFIGNHFEENKIIQIAYTYEQMEGYNE